MINRLLRINRLIAGDINFHYYSDYIYNYSFKTLCNVPSTTCSLAHTYPLHTYTRPPLFITVIYSKTTFIIISINPTFSHILFHCYKQTMSNTRQQN